ncbi:TPA: hypothetical protein I7160_02215 [Vibrio vulnificus]|nr:hypothetical protein [Vibrio vulnificus]
MPRTSLDVNKELFDRIRKRLGQDGYSDCHQAVYLSTELEEKNWIIEATSSIDGGYGKLSCIHSDNGIKFSELFFNDERYIVVNRSINFELDSALFQFEEPNAGVFTLAAWSEVVDLNESNLSILYEYFMFQDDSKLKGLAYGDLIDKECFNEFSLIKVKSLVATDLTLCRLASFILNEIAKSCHQNKIVYIDSCYSAISELMIRGGRAIPYDIIFSGLSHFNNPKFLFLDLYRVIERLFSRVYVSTLNRLLDTQIEHDKLNKSVEKATGWRPNEESELKGLVSRLDSSIVLELYSELSKAKSLDMANDKIERAQLELDALISTDSPMENIEQKRVEIFKSKATIIAERIYKIRNSMVHYRVIFDDYIKIDDVYIVNSVMCVLVNKIYSLYEDELTTS